MLQSRILLQTQGVSYGSGTLKQMQNKSLPILDLLVREAIQNSSDAAINQPWEQCNINFTEGCFSPAAFNALFSDIGPVLGRRFPEEHADYLEIRDSKTSGLTGPEDLITEADTEDHGNYYKLIFDNGKEQSNPTAGGAWGYGKSVYYRLGIGLVVFYSQFRENGELKSRLIIALNEKEDKNDAILGEVEQMSAGRAWWGKTRPGIKDKIFPVTDHEEIRQILSIFSIQPFADDQTGTSIIIPYIDKAELLRGIFPDNCGVSEDEIAVCSFKDDLAQYIALAVQKWYAPRVFNKTLGKYSKQKWLAVRVNGAPITDRSMRPLFRLVQELYTTALSASIDESDKYQSELFPFIKCVRVPSNKLVGDAGYAAFVRVTKEELGSGSAISPYTYLRLFGKSASNDPIVMFARTPGMVLDYKIDGEWAKGIIKPESEDEYTFVFYVPNSNAHLKDDPAAGAFSAISFEEYLRACEESDHADWEDPSTYRLVANIKAQICNKVNGALRPDADRNAAGNASKLSGKLGKKLLPTINFGKLPGGGSGGGGGGSRLPENPELRLISTTRNNENLIIEFSAKFNNAKKAATLEIFIESEIALMNLRSWQKKIGGVFPISVLGVCDCETEALNSGQKLPLPHNCDPEHSESESELSHVKICSTAGDVPMCGFEVCNFVTNALVTGKLIIRTSDEKIRVELREAKNTL